jgi:hypothetical protein
METINKYKIYCETEEVYVSGYGEEAPTKCYNDGAHIINENSVRMIYTIRPNEVVIQDEDIPTKRMLQLIPVKFIDVGFNSTETFEHIFEIQRSVFGFLCITGTDNIKDTVTGTFNEKTPVGILNANSNIGDSVFTVSSTVLDNVFNGLWIILDNGTTSEEVGMIIDVDKLNSTITLNNTAEHAFTAGITIVKVTYYIFKDLPIGQPGALKVGDEIMSGTTIPLGSKLRVYYTNKSLLKTKTFVIYITTLF